MSDVVATPRLTLVPLTTALLRAVVGGDLAEVERELEAPVGAGWEQGVPAALRLEQLEADPSEQPWLVRAMVAWMPRRVVGSIGFHDPPDDRGRVEIGYDVVTAERRKGYAREAIHALLDWGRRAARAPASPLSARTTDLRSRSSGHWVSGARASRSTRSTDWSGCSSGNCHSRAERRRSHCRPANRRSVVTVGRTRGVVERSARVTRARVRAR